MTVSSTSLDADPALAALVAALREQTDACVFLSGGASGMSGEAQRQLLAMFDALARLGGSGRALLVGDGGTDAGIMRAAGEARRASGHAFVLLGVAPAREIPPRGRTPVEPNHSHIVAVDNPAVAADEAGWGSEIDTMYWLFDRLAAGRPSVTIVANGGDLTLREVAANVRAGRPVILIAGSGRVADALVSLLTQATPADEEVKTLRERAAAASHLLRRPELFRVVALGDGASGLYAALADALDGRR